MKKIVHCFFFMEQKSYKKFLITNIKIKIFSSGKKFTIRGIEKNEKGILIQTVEDLLGLLNFSGNSSNEKKKLLCSIYCGYKNESIDLLSKSKIDVI